MMDIIETIRDFFLGRKASEMEEEVCRCIQ
jgi:hypothetical protein